MERAPWSTCPGAVAVLEQTFVGIALQEFRIARGQARQLHASARSCRPRRSSCLRHRAHAVRHSRLRSRRRQERGRTAPQRHHGARLERGEGSDHHARTVGWPRPRQHAQLDRIPGPKTQEAARLLRWGTMVAHGRTLPAGWASRAGNMASRSRCYTFQPHRAGEAKHVGAIRDFSRGTARPLEHPASPAPQDSDPFHVTRDHA